MTSEDPGGDTPGVDADSTDDAERAPTVLLVDDEARLTELYEHWLGDNFETRVALGGEEALELMDDSVDVVTLDRRMPDLTGDDVLHAIKEEGYDAGVVMVTAVDADVDLVDLPIDDYLTKPVTRDVLVDVVNRLVQITDAPTAVRQYHSLERRRDVLRTATTLKGIEREETFDLLTRRLEKVAEQAGAGLAWLDEDYYGEPSRTRQAPARD